MKRPFPVKTMWTPWRLQYITGRTASGCIFCNAAAADPRSDRENYVVCRGRHNFVILNLYPYNNGHLMVVPYAHVAGIEDLDAATLLELGQLVQSSVRALRSTLRPEGFNIGANMGTVAGAGVADHVHVHVVPRWKGDTNFMTVVGQVRLIPELLTQTYDNLVRAGLGTDVASAAIGEEDHGTASQAAT